MKTSILDEGEAAPIDIAELARQARAAFDQKRIKECIALTNALAMADPDNAEARALQSVVYAGIQRDLNDARALLEDSRNAGEGQKYRKAAEIILLKILYLDPANEQAKVLLSSIKGAAETSAGAAIGVQLFPKPSVVAAPASSAPAHQEPAAEVAITESTPKTPLMSGAGIEKEVQEPWLALTAAAAETAPAKSARPVQDEEIAFTTGTLIAPKKEEKKPRAALPVALAFIVLVAGVLLLARHWWMAAPPPSEERTASPASASLAHAADAVPVNKPARPKDDTPPVSSTISTPPPAASVPAAPVTPAPVPSVRVEPPVQTGTLSLSSPVAAEIYMGEKRVGSTPATLKLPVGRQTLEYRFRNRNAVVTYEIKANQTTAASVTFDTTVQINARPWAEIFLEDGSRRSLGQTPLSNVRVPIGSVLVFENPNFPSKTQTHRVTEEDTVIQVVFQ